jgi:hypothetical protein
LIAFYLNIKYYMYIILYIFKNENKNKNLLYSSF